MDKTYFKKLIKKYLSGKTTSEEEQQLFKHYDAFQQRKTPWNDEDMGSQEDVKKKIFTEALTEITKRESRKSKIYHIYLNWRVAAILITVFSFAIYFYLNEQEVKIVKQQPEPVHNDVSPGGNKAILTLADGKQIILDNTNNGTITTQGNISVSKSKDGQLIYQIGNTQSAYNNVSGFNTISTPPGGQYQVILSDNTKVWLNANSSIKFPTAFNANERKVVIEGEAYFEVAKDKTHPFKVESNSQVIEVLGTHFNVNAYTDESFIKTTLLEGAVRIYAGSINKILKPGQQAKLSSKSRAINIINVDTEEAVAWKNGLFMFENEDIHSIMRKISRWYGVEVVYQDKEIDETFGGTISKFENVSQVLKLLEVTGTIHFKIEGRKITVMK